MTSEPPDPDPDPRRHGDDLPGRTPRRVFTFLAIAAGVGALLGAMVAIPCVASM